MYNYIQRIGIVPNDNQENEMTTAEEIVSNPINKTNGYVQHYLISTMAEKIEGVTISGNLRNPYYRFVDGSGLSVFHTTGDYKVW